MFLRFLFLAMLVVAAGPHDAIAEESDVFGFKWKMSYAEASKIASGRMEKMKKVERLSHYGKTEYEIDNPKKPPGATLNSLAFFNDELYSVHAAFMFDDDHEFEEKAKGLVEFLKSKHSEAKFSGRQKDSALYFLFDYSTEADVVENPYNLENVVVVARVATVESPYNTLIVLYSFYGTKKINTHIKTMKDKESFKDF